ncbi:hypothetical protein [Alkalihalobacterium bogoriense]|uniref:hypothetical protein n=1 Tax=Alkalihalobacterium bogoriense TaxID=246272 RepID=UPI000688B92E|nr:hypothetical protein [Alkalihalobacterium bogoriense]
MKIYFSISIFENSPHCIPTDFDYRYWLKLMNRFITRADTIEIHCWEEEKEVIEELKQRYDEFHEIPNSLSLVYFGGEMTDKKKEYLVTDFVNKHRQLKWFSIFLYKKGSCIFSSEHWGTEFFGNEMTAADVEFIKTVLPEESIVSVIDE